MADKRLQHLILAILAFLLVGGGYYYTYTNRNQGPVIIPSSDRQIEKSAPDQPETIKVYVGGAVAFPGVYELAAGAREEEAVRKASPLLEADLDALNLAKRLEDEQSIVVPKKRDSAGGQPGDSEGHTDSFLPQVQSDSKININTANEQELEQLPGVGSAIAGRIVEYRGQNGPFRSVEDLQNVSGIGEKKFEAVRHLISVN